MKRKVNKDEFFSMLEDGKVSSFTFNGVRYFGVPRKVVRMVRKARPNKPANFDKIKQQKMRRAYMALKSIREPDKLSEAGNRIVENEKNIWYKGPVKGVFRALLKIAKLRKEFGG